MGFVSTPNNSLKVTDVINITLKRTDVCDLLPFKIVLILFLLCNSGGSTVRWYIEVQMGFLI